MRKLQLKGLPALCLATLLFLSGAVLPAPARAVETQIVSVARTGYGASTLQSSTSVSASGRFVAFTSFVPGSNAFASEVLLRDTQDGTTQVISLDAKGLPASGTSQGASISADGRFVAFQSDSDDIIPRRPSTSSTHNSDIYVRDMLSGTTERVSVSDTGDENIYHADSPSISADERFVAFDSGSTNLVAGDPSNTYNQIFVRDRKSATAILVSAGNDGAKGNGQSYGGRISRDGHFIVFFSDADNLVPNDTTGHRGDLFLRDLRNGTTQLVSVSTAGQQDKGVDAGLGGYSISADGRFVIFRATSIYFAPGFPTHSDGTFYGGLFLRDTQKGTTQFVAQTADAENPSISADGRFITFTSPNALVPEDTNSKRDIYRIDLQNGTAKLVSSSTAGVPGNDDSFSLTGLSADENFIAYDSLASNLVAGDTNGVSDVFLTKLSVSSTGLVVNSTGDLGDSNTGDGVCGTGKTLDNGQTECTLRAAIQEANARPGADTITFDVPGAAIPAIQLTGALPPITDPVVIDGTTQAGKMVELSGGGTIDTGLTIKAGGSKLRGLVVNSFKGDGILLTGKGGNTVEGCFIGTDATGTLARGNGQSGIHALGSPDNLFGGTTDAARNIISGNRVPNTSTTPIGDSGYGIWIDGSTNNKVQGCFVGTDKSGTQGVPNGIGVLVGKKIVKSTTTSLPKLGAVIGGATASPGSAPGNLIAGNSNDGVYVGGSSGNTVVGNLIGIAKDGKTSLPNTNFGVIIFRAPGNTIGATNAGGRNVIGGVGGVAVAITGSQSSRNLVVGNFIGTDINGTGGNGPTGLGAEIGVYMLTASGNTIGGTTEGERNVICNNDAGIYIEADDKYRGFGNLNGTVDNNRVSGNYIGVDVSGGKVFGNTSLGVALLYRATGNIVENNVVAGSKIGVDLSSDNGRAKGNFVRSNLIGTDASGTLPLPNKFGIVVSGAAQNTIKANVLAGNSLVGLALYKGADENTIVANSIGTDRNGTMALGNGQYGVLILDSSRNTLRFNVVSGNGRAGVVVAAQLPPSYALADLPPVTDQALEAAGNTLERNFIGTTQSGRAALPNGAQAEPGTGGGVLLLSGAMGNSIGNAGAGNTISGNVGSGVLLLSEANLAAVSGNLLAANNIGVAVNGASSLPNSGSGVRFVGANNNGIGSAPKQKNIIAFNQGDGVTVVSGKGNVILANSIYENRKLGINLVGGTEDSFGVTANDELDADQGANSLQNYPELTKVTRVGDSTAIEATLHSTPSKKFVIEFFSNDKRDPSGYGQGRRSLGVLPVTTDAAGVAAIGTLVPGVLSADQSVSMTATGDDGTSEFSGLGYSITGQVYRFVPDPSNPQGTIRQGIEGAVVERLEGQGKDSRIAATTMSNAQGFYVFGAAPAGTYAIVVKKDAPDFSYDFDPQLRPVTLPAPQNKSGAPNFKGADFVTYNISGQVADAGGKPLVGVPIALVGASGNSKEGVHDVKRAVVSDKQGHYVFDGLGSGVYVVSAGDTFSPDISPTLFLPAFGNVKGTVPGTPGIAPNRVFDFTLKAPTAPKALSGGRS